jgi:predicted phosphodiesterase
MRIAVVSDTHGHVPREERVGKTLVLNPGALYRANPRTFAVVDLPELTVRRIAVN